MADEAGKQYIDVGIAEEHAIAMSSGIAKNGGKLQCLMYIVRSYNVP